MKTRTEKLREASGTVTHTDALTSFLYELMRDHLSAGVVERIVMNSTNSGPTTYTNGWLAQYANNLAEELRNAQTNKLAEVLETAFGDINANETRSPSEVRPSFKVQEIKKLKEEVSKKVSDEVDSIADDFGLSLVEQLEQTGQISQEESSRLRKEIEELKSESSVQETVYVGGGSDSCVEQNTVQTNEDSNITYAKKEE